MYTYQNSLLATFFILHKIYIYKDYNINFWTKVSLFQLFKIKSTWYLRSAENHQTMTDFPKNSNLDRSLKLH